MEVTFTVSSLVERRLAFGDDARRAEGRGKFRGQDLPARLGALFDVDPDDMMDII